MIRFFRPRYGLFLLVWVLAACGDISDLPDTPAQSASTNGAAVQHVRSGSTTAWSGGLRAWSGGLRAWSGGSGATSGSGAVLFENEPIWNRISLQVAHQVLAPSLGKDVVVAVIDTGIDYRHPIFRDRLVDRSQWRDFVDDDTDPQEMTGAAFGHGTMVASLVLQVAPDAKIMPLRVLDGDGTGEAGDVALAVRLAVQQGADVVQLSLGTETPEPGFGEAVAEAAAAGVYVVASAGNSNANPTYPAYTAMLETPTGMMSVGVGSVDLNNRKSWFSNFALEDDLIEDGLEMVSFGEAVYGAVPGSQIAAWDGTSMAAPMVAGALALAIGDGAELLSPRTLALEVVESGLEIDSEGTVGGVEFELEQRLEVGLFLCSALNLSVSQCQESFDDDDDDDSDDDD